MTRPLTSLARFLLLLAVVLPSLSACGYYRSPGERLREAVLMYNDAVRWQRWKAAARYIPTEKREEFTKRREAQQDSYRVTDFEIRDVNHDSEKKEAQVVVEFAWHRYPSLTVTRTRMRQRWEYRDSDWVMASQEEVKVDEPEEGPAKVEDIF